MRSATLLASLFSFAWAAVALAADRPSASQTVSVAGSQPAAKGAAEYFTGNVRVDPLFAAKDTAPFSGAYVTFEPGARSAWHTHPAGQHLIVTSGVGWTQEWGGPVTEIRTGDVVWCPPGIALARRDADHRHDARRPDRNGWWQERELVGKGQRRAVQEAIAPGT